ncbi:hypothetical protein [Lentilactobacillus sp. Marseille-Q4993]|uniref:hypothetical protein n=1 Tax=Lentilactobacillus sp. Marseille-Q4993 TaxID=3039492 RepID=UPI0024BC0271|nr:hypothetical protein [Lentilactobacillus sp. Marseille-Q4993]
MVSLDSDQTIDVIKTFKKPVVSSDSSNLASLNDVNKAISGFTTNKQNFTAGLQSNGKDVATVDMAGGLKVGDYIPMVPSNGGTGVI